MKKLYTLILSVTLISTATKAQLTLTRAANEPVIGDVVTRQMMDSTAAMPITTTGTNVVWNFTALTSNTAAPNSSTYKNPTTVPSATAYPSCTVVEDMGSTGFSYWQSVVSPQNFAMVGTNIIVGTNTAVINFSNSGIVAQYPITLGYSLSDPIAGSVNVSTLSGTFTGTVTTLADGTGTLNLQNSITYANCLRVKSTQVLNLTLMSIFPGTVTNTSYSFYHSSQKFPIFTIVYSQVTVPAVSINQTTIRIEENTAIFAGIKENSSEVSSLNLFPNPTNTNFNLSYVNENADQVTAEISNTVGQIVKKENLGNAKGSVNQNIDISNLEAGVYFVKVNVGAKTSVKKLTVQ